MWYYRRNLGLAAAATLCAVIGGLPGFANAIYEALQIERSEAIFDQSGMKYLALADKNYASLLPTSVLLIVGLDFETIKSGNSVVLRFGARRIKPSFSSQYLILSKGRAAVTCGRI